MKKPDYSALARTYWDQSQDWIIALRIAARECKGPGIDELVDLCAALTDTPLLNVAELAQLKKLQRLIAPKPSTEILLHVTGGVPDSKEAVRAAISPAKRAAAQRYMRAALAYVYLSFILDEIQTRKKFSSLDGAETKKMGKLFLKNLQRQAPKFRIHAAAIFPSSARRIGGTWVPVAFR
jgi:hypothetical protein